MKYRGLTRQESQQGPGYRVRCGVVDGADSKRHYVGIYLNEEEAARAYDLAALALGKQAAELNFPRETYSESDIQAMRIWLNRPRDVKSSQFVGVRRKKTRWDARLRVKDRRVHLGYFDTEQDAAVQYDLAHLVTHQLDAAACSQRLNFDWSDVPREQINNMSTNVRLRISQKVGPDIIEQQMQQQTQQPSDEQHQQQEPELCSRDVIQQVAAQQPQQQQCAQNTSQDASLSVKQQAKQQLQQARLAVKKYKSRLQSKLQLSSKKREKLKAAKKAAKAALKEAKQHLKLIKQRSAAAVEAS